MPDIVGSIKSVVGGFSWTNDVYSYYNTLQMSYGNPAQFAISMAWPFTYFCTIRSVDKQKYVQWTADGRILISDTDSSTNWDDLDTDLQKSFVFSYSEPNEGWFRLQLGKGNGNVVAGQSGYPNYLLAQPDVDDFSLFVKP